MFNLLHTFHPTPILLSLGPVHIYWYGFFIVLATLAALATAIYLAKFYQIKTDTIIDLAFWLIIAGLIGARIYDILAEWPYLWQHPLDIFKIWQGGLAIHGAIIGGAIALWWFAKKHNHNFWQLAAIIATVLPLAQAIGRWGNYFNQELFGYPANLPWGIPIDILNRPRQFLSYEYFHPTFLYESLGEFFIFVILIALFCSVRRKSASHQFQISNFKFQISVYFLLYSLLRFFLEFIRVDATPVILGLRLPQLVSLLIIAACLAYWLQKFIRKAKPKPALDK